MPHCRRCFNSLSAATNRCPCCGLRNPVAPTVAWQWRWGAAAAIIPLIWIYGQVSAPDLSPSGGRNAVLYVAAGAAIVAAFMSFFGKEVTGFRVAMAADSLVLLAIIMALMQ
jgi:hypothetical protein